MELHSSSSATLVQALEDKMDARFLRMETAFRAGLSQVTSSSNASAAAPVADALPPKVKKSSKGHRSRSSSSSSKSSISDSSSSESSDDESDSDTDMSKSRERRKKCKGKGKYHTKKYFTKKLRDKDITYERMVLANAKMALAFYKKGKKIKGLLQHIVLIAEKAEPVYFTAEALSNYDESVKSAAHEIGPKVFKRADPTAIVKHLSYEGTVAAERARQGSRATGRKRQGRGSGVYYACYRYNYHVEGCKGGCGYRHICASCGGQGHLGDDCSKKPGGNQGGRK